MRLLSLYTPLGRWGRVSSGDRQIPKNSVLFLTRILRAVSLCLLNKTQ